MRCRIIAGVVMVVMFLSGLAYAGMKEANALAAEKKYAEAEVEYRKALATVKTPSEKIAAKFGIATALRLQEKKADSITAYRDILTEQGLKPYHKAAALANVANLQILSQDGDAAEETLKEQLAVEGNATTTSFVKQAVTILQDFTGLGDKLALQLRTQPAVDDEGVVTEIRTLLLKAASSDASVARVVITECINDPVVVKELYNVAKINALPMKEKVTMLVDIWEAHTGEIEFVGGVLSDLKQVIPLSEQPTIFEARKIIAEMK